MRRISIMWLAVALASLGPEVVAQTAPAERSSALARDLAALPRVQEWDLKESLLEELGPLPTGTLALPVAEVYRADRAVLLLLVVESDRLLEEILAMGFEHFESSWRVREEDLGGWAEWETFLAGEPFRSGAATDTMVERFETGQTKSRLIRSSGLPLADFPAFLPFALSEQPARFSAAVESREWETSVEILRETMSGFSLRAAEDTLKTLLSKSPPSLPADLRLVREETQDDRAQLVLEAIAGDDRSTLSLSLRREGGGWVILSATSM